MTDDEIKNLLRERLAGIRGRIAGACARAGRNTSDVTLVAVTKTVRPRIAAMLPELGFPDLGENRPQELWKKRELIPHARWHLIGHLQRNKIDRTLPGLTLIHSVDSLRLLHAIQEFGAKANQVIPCLLEINCSREEAKGGFAPHDLISLSDSLMSLTHVAVRGLMTMAAFHDDPEQARSTFTELRSLRDQLAVITSGYYPVLSMGMTNDFEVAIEEGATHVRIGTALFQGLDAE